ncbi:hypothetical protein C5C31_08785 [Rathayibacter rathayi]|uniref:Uncharacterized protein n=1 Tax=Rathayibacter rathayi TaxID=33887 RepID=A0ABD6W610_RATRA|nr:hypothetical protein [Rathayibacter rathayi]AZZ49995.1 hypothetical protein C1O28_13030 [Rathayibacter rathayi]MWV75281.1 hypothetical protein [Rathayibacter rathayi NCPPB 2980 = VKM Ac-1601]PPF10563.1 hypothetical protein C5C04_13200 [Rathayibacter rathayi]PPF23078.1 hypothetical protein C5C34_10065 [Rathayibacter rathayi]PPF75345.1 hypothetical protein C5C14_14330 [Rathayibacter rathayi]
MNDQNPYTSHEIRIDDGWSIPASDGVHRRTLVKGTAWTVPVVAVSMATPAAAASGGPTLTFTQTSYSGKACGTITGVQVKRTTDGSTADPGKVVTVKLANGYRFADRSTSVSRTTGTDGLITLPDIKVPARGGDSTFSATSDSLSASAPVKTAFKSDGAYVANKNGAGKKHAKVPGDATPLQGNYFLKGNTLYHEDTVVASDVEKAAGYNTGGSTDYVAYVTTNGKAWLAKGDGPGSEKAAPADSTPLAGNYFLSKDGALYHAGTEVASDVKRAAGYNAGDTNDYVAYVKNDGKAWLAKGDGPSSTKAAPDDSTPLQGNYFLSKDGALYHGGTKVADKVKKAAGYNTGGSTDYVTYVTTDGKAYIAQGDGPGSEHTSVANDSTPLAGNYFLSKDGTLYHGDKDVETDVVDAAGYNAGNDDDYVTYTKANKC